MPRGSGHDSDDSDDEKVLESELDKLILNYKKAEQERQQYVIEVQKAIRLQK